MINNAKKEDRFFLIKKRFLSIIKERRFTNWPEESLKAYINGGVIEEENKINLSCAPEWEAKTFAVSYAARTNFIKKLSKQIYVPYASQASTLSTEVRDMLSRTPISFLKK